ncbi:MAG TPA: hypothetical protein VE912_25795, partial [Bacteroidales bacterium]|nr:hypothetical protein [Bacteroidales bacterium]
MNKFKSLLLIAVSVIFGYQAYGQHKIPMDHKIYNDWKHAGHVMITDDGNYIGYNVIPGKGDGLYCIYNVKYGSSDTIPRAYEVKVTDGSKFLVGKIAPPEQLIRQARKEKKNKKDYPHDSLFIYNLSTGEKNIFADVESFA